MNPKQSLAEMISESGRCVFFGGAGVSTGSGIPDFRSESGLYRAKSAYGHAPEVMLSKHFLMTEPETFLRYFRENLAYPEAKPNDAHRALASLEKAGLVSAVITQNIDGLHQAAGSENVLELHGSNWRWRCTRCNEPHTLAQGLAGEGIPRCQVCAGVIRPMVVLYGEPPDPAVMQAAARELAYARLVIVGGTSLSVYPAAGLLDTLACRLAVINKTPTKADARADLVIREPVADVLAGAAAELGLSLT